MPGPAPSMPQRRTEDLTIQHVGNEMLLYDERTHRAFCINEITAAVWNHCDGSRTPAAIAALVSASADSLTREAVVCLALSKLADDDLIEGYTDFDLSVVSRRAMLAKGGAGLALMLPVIAMIAAPKAAQAYSGCFDCSNASTNAQRRRAAELEQERKGKEEANR